MDYGKREGERKEEIQKERKDHGRLKRKRKRKDGKEEGSRKEE